MKLQENDGKRIIAADGRHLDQTFLAYGLFEEKHHLLESLTRRQLELIVPSQPRRILDVGCGTGISAMALHNFLACGPPPRIFAIDINESMLAKAKERYRNIPGLYFVRGDADNLSSFFHEGFDGIFYTPSLFQIPNFRESLRQAAALLVPGGVLTTCHYAGLYTEDGEEAIAKVFPELKYGPGTCSGQDIDCFFGANPGFRSTWFDFRFEVQRDFLFDFLSVPGQSHALFPKIPYLERIPMIREACGLLEGKAGRVFMGWKFCVGRKSRKLDS